MVLLRCFFQGEGVQSFFNVNSYADPADGYNNAINTRSKLQSYDSALYSFVQQLFPCANNYIKRCSSRGMSHDSMNMYEYYINKHNAFTLVW